MKVGLWPLDHNEQIFEFCESLIQIVTKILYQTRRFIRVDDLVEDTEDAKFDSPNYE